MTNETVPEDSGTVFCFKASKQEGFHLSDRKLVEKSSFVRGFCYFCGEKQNYFGL